MTLDLDRTRFQAARGTIRGFTGPSPKAGDTIRGQSGTIYTVEGASWSGASLNVVTADGRKVTLAGTTLVEVI